MKIGIIGCTENWQAVPEVVLESFLLKSISIDGDRQI